MVAAEDKGGSGPPPTALSNASLFERACRVTPGGVNSPVRAFKAVGGAPYFVARGKGAYVADVEGVELYRLRPVLRRFDPRPCPPQSGGGHTSRSGGGHYLRRADTS